LSPNAPNLRQKLPDYTTAVQAQQQRNHQLNVFQLA